ncbi:ATP-binding protein [Geovibrio sp. ADMFC3]
MAKIPFNVSARTARLIGRENVANATGAITELVKNSYDADSKVCIIYIDNQFNTIPDTINKKDFYSLNTSHSDYYLISIYYSFSNKIGKYVLNYNLLNNHSNDDKNNLLAFFKSHCRIIIIDNGEGMSQDTIINYWMTIGTSNKQDNFMSSDGRVKTGAKGIGRFALDRLGQNCTMKTKMIDGYTQVWDVDWGLFDNHKTALISDVTADLSEVNEYNIEQYLNLLPESFNLYNYDFSKGTVLEISCLRDVWSCNDVAILFSNLELLIPPREVPFNLYLYTTLEKDSYGPILPTLCDDFDYKFNATFKDGIFNIEVIRNEYITDNIPDEFFTLANSKDSYRRYDRYSFDKKFNYTKTAGEILPGLNETTKSDLNANIGDFDFTMYFTKLQTTKEDMRKYKYKDFNAHSRKTWMGTFGGIKIFRDNFRVRPYGEAESSAWDWLGLGLRQAVDPASVKRFKRYRVRPNNVYGVINISRLTNINFEDKSSREGIQENKHFELFKNLIIALIEEFEDERSYIASILDKVDEVQNVGEHNSRKAKTNAKIIRKKLQNKSSMTKDEEVSYQMALEIESQQETIEEMRGIQRLLKAFASNGIMIAAFAHELHGIHGNLVNRMTDIENYIAPFISQEDVNKLPRFENPYIMLEEAKNDDLKLKQWLSYTLGTIRKDKRKREKKNITEYFEKFKNNWQPSLDYRNVQLDIAYKSTEISLRFFEIELDSIFNNLLMNSFDVFRIKGVSRRIINIDITESENKVEIIYKDSGPGLSEDIKDPNIIFEALFTTKKDQSTGKDIGTGLGMWLVKSIAEDNDGQIEFIETNKFFAIKIVFPIKYTRRG